MTMRGWILLFLFSTSLLLTSSLKLNDSPLSGDSFPFSLDGSDWKITNSLGSIAINGRVPGDLITDLQNADIIGDPLYEMNFKSTLWDDAEFTYTKEFVFPQQQYSNQKQILVFDGIKMGSHIFFNAVQLGSSMDQFLRYTFDVSDLIYKNDEGKKNTIQVTFPVSNNTINDQSRYMACSGAWDWAPYTSTYNSFGSHSMTKGIWKNVYIVTVSTTAIEHVVPHVTYNGPYPTAPLTDSSASSFTVKTTVFFVSPVATAGTLEVSGGWGTDAGASVITNVNLPAGNFSVSVSMETMAGKVQLWWPNEMGSHTLYPVTAKFTPASSTAGPAVSSSRNIGFRVIYLVTGDDSDPSTLKGQDGSGNFTMRFKVNGANVWSRGSNIIPMEEMEGRQTAEAYYWMVRAAVDSHYNTFRIWGKLNN